MPARLSGKITSEGGVLYFTGTPSSGDKFALDVYVVNQVGAGGEPASSVAVTNFPASQAVTGTFYQATQPVSGTFWQATQPVSGTFWQATQPVSGTFWQATQPISGTVTINAIPAGTNNIGDVDVLTLPALPAGTNNIGDVDVLTLPVLTDKAAASSAPIGTVSLGNSLGKTNTMKTGTLVTTAVTADQVILTYTVTAGKTFYLEYFDISCRLTTFAATATNFGNFSLESAAGTKLYTQMASGTGVVSSPIAQTLTEPLPIAAGVVIRVVCTPSATTSFTWVANFGGYEK